MMMMMMMNVRSLVKEPLLDSEWYSSDNTVNGIPCGQGY